MGWLGGTITNDAKKSQRGLKNRRRERKLKKMKRRDKLDKRTESIHIGSGLSGRFSGLWIYV